MDVAGGILMYGLLVAGLYGLAVLAGWVNAWWRMRQHNRAMDRVSARLRCTPACREGHTWSWPCERSPMRDREVR